MLEYVKTMGFREYLESQRKERNKKWDVEEKWFSYNKYWWFNNASNIKYLSMKISQALNIILVSDLVIRICTNRLILISFFNLGEISKKLLDSEPFRQSTLLPFFTLHLCQIHTVNILSFPNQLKSIFRYHFLPNLLLFPNIPNRYNFRRINLIHILYFILILLALFGLWFYFQDLIPQHSNSIIIHPAQAWRVFHRNIVSFLSKYFKDKYLVFTNSRDVVLIFVKS